MKTEKTKINQLHRIAEFQKKLAWANFEAAKRSTMFKKELLECAKVAAQNCRDTRQMIKNIIENRQNDQLNQKWAAAGCPDDYWD